MTQLLYVAGGGALGALLRYAAVLLSQHLWGRDFPYGTLLVNVLGSLLIGLAYVWIVERLALGEAWRLAFMVGVLGAFTTFSSFSIETLQLFERGAAVAALANILLNVSLCLAACWLGLMAARQL
ncbi:MAG: fluoride efflux transporter CrcB [Nevskiales bacterium]